MSSALVIPLGRQGPGRLAPAVIARLEHKLRRRAARTLPGEHLTPGAGDGMELAQLRLYEPGDDVRRLDPAASARTGEPHVRLQVPERAVTTWLVLDVSPSMAFGTRGRLKSDVAEGVAEVVGRVGVRRGGRVALVVAGGAEPRILPPRPGRSALAALRAVVREGVVADARTQRAGQRPRPVDADPAPSPLAAALTRVARVARSTGVLVVVSDFRDEGWAAALRAAGARHTVLAVSAALDRLEARRGKGGDTAPAAIVLLSDGKTTGGSDPLRAADRAKQLGVPISTVALGTDEGVVTGPSGEPFGVPPDPETLKAIAERSGGQAYAVDDADQFDRTYEQLGSRIGTRQEDKDVGSTFAAGGLVLLLGGLVTGLRRRGGLV